MRKIGMYFKFMVLAGALFGVFFGVGAGVANLIHNPTTPTTVDADEVQKKEEGKRTNILVLGVDARPGEKNSRSDTIMLVSIDPQLNKAAVISIPRDTKVDVPGGSYDKINAANYVGGPELAMRTVEQMLDIKIDNYVQMDFKGFKSIVDTLGGVTINVPQRMYKPSEGIDLRPGTQRLNGYQALALVRFRDYVMADIQRTAQQQEFIKALVNEALKPATLTKLPTLARQCTKYIETDLTLKDMLKMASWVPGFNSESVVAQTLPGYFYDKRDSYGNLTCSYWVADKNELPGLLENMFAGQTLAVVKESPYPELNPGKQIQQQSQEEPENPEPEEEESPDGTYERSKLPSPGHE